ncbi:MAG: cytochrome P450 [Anaerolineae bacterium]
MTGETTDARQAPGPKGWPVVGSLFEMRRQGILDFWTEAWRAYGDVVQTTVGPMTLIQFVRPEHVQEILVTKRDTFVKGLSHDTLRLPLGRGLLTAEGELWRRQRRLMAPTYTPRGVKGYAAIMLDATDRMLARWRTIPDGMPLAMNVEMMRLAMSVISRSVFTIDIGEEFAEAGEALGVILDFASARTVSPVSPPLWVPTPLNRRFKWALATMDDFLYGIIARRRSQPSGDDLLWQLMAVRDEETGAPMSDEQLRDEVLITFFAGHETTAQLLTWAWYLLACHPEVEARFHGELDGVLRGRRPGVDDLEPLCYTRMIMDEVLRLYSPVATMARDAVADAEVGGYHVPAGSIVTICPYVTHRHPEFWARPGDFYPEHFEPQAVEARPRYAYYPFGAGPRVCLGKHFALLEAALVLAEVGQRYRPRLVSDEPVGVRWSGTLRPDRDVMMRLEERG